MSGLPKLPGYGFRDPTLNKFNLSHTFDYINGYQLPKRGMPAAGGRQLDVNSVAYIQSEDPVRYDPSLTYGRTRSVALPQYLPHYALYDQKCLTFKAFFKQSVFESPLEHYRVRIVNIIYFLEDDSITVIEPRIQNCGLDQGRLVKRGKVPKNTLGDSWHWKDLNIGKDIPMFGIVYHIVSCDVFTREFMKSQGILLEEPEEVPPDPCMQQREMQVQRHEFVTPAADDKLRRFLEYDGKVLKFDAVWDTREEEFGELRPYNILYFLSDDTVSVKELNERNSGRDPFPQFLRKTKLPKVWTDRPQTYPSCYLELSDAEVTEYYQPKDFLVGETIYVLGRPMLLVDCDEFTRNYARKVLCIEQKQGIVYKEKPKPTPEKPMPPHDAYGSLEDSLQNTVSFLPKPPRKDVIKQLVNANKYLRYVMKFDVVHPEDEIRRFLLRYSMAEGTCDIYEPPIRDSGILGGPYLKNSLFCKPGTDPLNPEYYTPADFYIGAVITVHSQRFIIIDADLYVYRYIQANPEKFPCCVVDNLRKHMYNKGYLSEDIDQQIDSEKAAQKKAERNEVEDTKTEMEKCMIALKGGIKDEVYEEAKRKETLQKYEDSLKHTYVVPEHGIQPVNLTCIHPVVIGKPIDLECKEGDVRGDAYTPKHIDTPEEIEQKYYTDVLQRQHYVCEHGEPVVCDKPELLTRVSPEEKSPEPYQPLMRSGIEYPQSSCKIQPKTVRFADDDHCRKDRYDICELKTQKIPCECTVYEKPC